MKVIIAGSRSIKDYRQVLEAVRESGFVITEVVSGTAGGVDKLGERYAKEHNIPVKLFPAEWDNLEGANIVIKTNSHGKQYNALAGFTRNTKMAEYADALILIWDGQSNGSHHMLKEAEKHKLNIYVKQV